MRPGNYNVSLTVSCKKCSPPAVNDSVSVTLTPGICQEETGQYKPDGSVANDGQQCCFEGQGIPNYPITDLDKCPNKVQKPDYDPGVNGCTAIPDNPMWASNNLDPIYTSIHSSTDGNFLDACNYHDACYSTCNNEKISCDVAFGDIMKERCNRDFAGSGVDLLYRDECIRLAVYYETAVTLMLPQFFYNPAQKEACNCCYR